jgi:hypothetical protein
MKIAIFNGFCFHYETFGVFLYYCKTKGYSVTLYTEHSWAYNWFGFYNRLFDNFFVMKHFGEFLEPEFNSYDFIILPTDDDFTFKDKFLSLPNADNKILTYDHEYYNRRPQIRYHVATRPYTKYFCDLPSVYPVYPVVSKEDKLNALKNEPNINIALIGGYVEDLVENINKIKVNNDISKLKLHFINRNPNDAYTKILLDTGLDVNFYYAMDAVEMFKLLKKTQYVLFVGVQHKFTSCSGSGGLSFANGCTMLMTREYNDEYNFKNAIYFDDMPNLQNIPNLDTVYEEQQEILTHNFETLDSFINKTGYYSPGRRISIRKRLH